MNRKQHIIIPSAILVRDELQYLGKLPAVVYPINQHIVFDYLYDQYNASATSIRVICGEGSVMIHDQLAKYETCGKVFLEDLPAIKDLGFTVQYGIRNLADPVIINFGDTVVNDAKLTVEGAAAGGCYYYSEDIPSEKWTFFEEEHGKITEVYDKIAFEQGYIKKKKLFVGVFLILKTRYFCKCLEEAQHAPDRKISTFFYALRLYSESYPLRAIKAEQWFDIGHADKYRHFGLEAKAREFNHIGIDNHRGILRKTSEEKEKFIGEIKWYLKLPSDIEYVRPRIFDYSVDYNEPYVVMEYYAYHTLHELFLYGDLSIQQWVDIFDCVRFVCKDFRRYSMTGDTLKSSLADIYNTKTLARLNQLRKEERFVFFFKNQITINGKIYKKLDEICELLTEKIPQLLYDVEKFTIIHGDLCFSNIMVDDNFSFIKLIDPRGKFGAHDIYGDPRYEIAKLLHCVDGKYDYIIKNLFKLTVCPQKAEINYKISDRRRGFDLYEVFIDTFQEEIGIDLNKIELIEALLFLSMIPLHTESFEQQLVMMATGLDILNRVINIEEGG